MRSMTVTFLTGFIIMNFVAAQMNAETFHFEAEDFIDSEGKDWEILKPPFDAPVQVHDHMAKEIRGKAKYTIVEASNGAFIGIPNGPGDRLNVMGGAWIKYVFNVPAAGSYYIWARAIAPTVGDNSMYWGLDIDDDKAVSEDNKDINIWDFYEAAQFRQNLSADWVWFQINSRSGPFNGPEATQNGQNPKPMRLSAGDHTLHIVHREDGIYIDVIFATTNKAQDPSKVLPSLAVSPQGKLAITWGNVRRKY